MIRRRRRVREIPFSFDSFLDVVANVVGIIIRLILVVWVGARSYSTISLIGARVPHAGKQEKADVAVPQDPLAAELALRQSELDALRDRLLKQLRELDQARSLKQQTEQQLTAIKDRRQDIRQRRVTLDQQSAQKAGADESLALSRAELRQREQKLLDEIHDLEKLPPPSHVLRYRTPVSRPVHADEFFFEVHAGRVAFIDVPSLIAEARQNLDSKGQLLRNRWQVSDVTAPVGAFRLSYTLAREPGLADALTPGGSPESSSGFRYGLAEWVVEPVAATRGETLEAALAERSEFRRLVDRLDPEVAAVTFWVYPDSFSVYRRLRDYLYDHNLVVAGRPLPEGVPITCSRNGTLSQGQ
jgi:hypothetical protein